MTKYVYDYNEDHLDYNADYLQLDMCRAIPMNTRSAKAKGHKLEYLVRDMLLEIFELDKEDIRANIGGETGEDLKLSKRAQERLPFKIECKSRAKMAVYTYYKQAMSHPGDNLEPVVVLKADRKKPLIVIDLEYFLGLI